MLSRDRVRLSRCNLLPTVALVGISFVVLTSAAPVSREKVAAAIEIAAKGESEKPLIRAKRADEIIFDNVQNVAGASSAGSLPVKKSDQQIDASSDDVTNSAGKQPESSPTANTEPETVQKDTDADESVGNEDNGTESDGSDSSDHSASDSADSVSWDSDNDDAAKRRRRGATDSEAKGGEAVADRAKREASAAMVAENMAVPGTGNSRLQRAKRDLDREIFEARLPMVESVGDGRGSDYGASDYGSPRDYADAIVTPSEDGEDEDEGGEYEDSEEDTSDEEEFDDENPKLNYVGRPKRRSTLTEDEREEALEEAERQVVRELLAERAAEETRQALINYLTGYEPPKSEPLRISERYDESFRNEGFEEGYGGDDEDNNEEENGFEEDEEGWREEPVDGGQEELIEDGDGRFLVEDVDGSEIEDQSPSIAEQKRFSYPYSYEPYGGRWGALLPGAKRDDHDPYDRLYQLAEALSRPSSVGGGSATDDEYKK